MASWIYKEVTEAIIASLEEGVPAWVKPWSTDNTGVPVALPVNCTTGRPYTGVNILLLWGRQIEMGWPTNEWAGLKQMEALGGRLKKLEGWEPPAGKPWATGQKSTAIVRVSEKFEENDAGERELVGRWINVQRVFNLAQFEGYDESRLKRSVVPDFELTKPQVQDFLDRQGVSVLHGGPSAYYSPAADTIVMPVTFELEADYLATRFHEQVHATGHAKRLGRLEPTGAVLGPVARKEYGFEELVAELGAAFLCARFGIEGQLQHEAYIGSWLKILGEDHAAIFRAAAAAERAVDFMFEQAGGEAIYASIAA